MVNKRAGRVQQMRHCGNLLWRQMTMQCGTFRGLHVRLAPEAKSLPAPHPLRCLCLC